MLTICIIGYFETSSNRLKFQKSDQNRMKPNRYSLNRTGLNMKYN